MDNAKSGDVITIGPGTYTENVLVNQKTDLVIRSYDGPENTVIAANDSTKNVIYIQNSGNITIEGLTVTGAGLNTAGIYVRNSDYCKVKDNLLHDDALGVYLSGSNYAVVSNNIATKNLLAGQGRAILLESSNYAAVSGNKVSNNRYGIYISNSRENTVSGNTVNLSADHGIVLLNTNKIVLENNNVNSNSNFGIYLSDSIENALRSNTVFNSTNGINLVSSSRNEISSNTISNDSIYPGTHAIFLNTSYNNVLQSNVVSNNDYGIAMRYSNGNNVLSNTVSSNNRGIYLTLTSSSNTLSGNLANSNTYSGIVLEKSVDNTIISNTAKSNKGTSTSSGISLSSSGNNNVANNDVSENRRGIYISSSSSGNTVSGNAVNSNTGYGILLETAGINNNLTSNTVSSNGGYGIYLVNSGKTYILNNEASRNDKGIYVTTSHGSVISNNTASNNINDGIMLSLSNDSILSSNTADYNNVGISLNSSRKNEISSNRVAWNLKAGMFLCPQSTNNLIFNNYLSNSVNANNNNNECTWNITKTPGRNIAGGPNLGGNYWADPIKNDDHSQIYANNDADGDGLIDVIYNGDSLIDYHPLLEVYLVLPAADFTTDVISGPAPLTVQFTDLSQNATEWNWNFGDGVSSPEQNPKHIYTAAGNYTVNLKASNMNGTTSKTAVITVLQDQGGNGSNVLPKADFSTSVTGGYAPLSVTFTDLSQGATSRNWDFGDGTSSVEQNPAHIYYAAGTYTVTLTAYNDYGPATKTVQIIVDRESSGGSGGSGGGGGGGSPEPARNVEVKELSQVFITNGKPIQFDFPKNVTAIVYLSFDSKKTAGKTTTIVEMLKNKSMLTPDAPQGEVYSYLNIWVGNSGYANSKNIENAIVCFRVKKSWIEDQNIDQSSIILHRYSDKKWNELPTTLLREDDRYLYFTSETPGFSPFAITAKKIVIKMPSDNENPEKHGSIESDIKKEPDQAGNTSISQKENLSTPGFEMIYCIFGLFGVLMYRRR